MPFNTEFAAVKEAFSNEAPNVSCTAPESRLSNATSDGELTRVSTRPSGGFVESFGKPR